MENINLQLEAKRFFKISGIEFWKINNSFMYPNVVIFYGDPEVEGDPSGYEMKNGCDVWELEKFISDAVEMTEQFMASENYIESEKWSANDLLVAIGLKEGF